MSKLLQLGVSLLKLVTAAAISATLTWALITVLSGPNRALQDRVDQGVVKIRRDVELTQALLCDILAQAESASIRQAVERYC